MMKNFEEKGLQHIPRRVNQKILILKKTHKE